ncbi:MAG: hypothetical protein ACYC0J_10445 [Gammaproteobacteria bacterium]
MFMFHVALSLCLIALTAGSALYVFSARCEGRGTCFANLVAIVVIVLSIITSLCTMYYGVKAWQQGSEQCPMCMSMMQDMHGMKMQDKPMMDGKGMSGGMMNPANMNNSEQTKNNASHQSQ